MLGLVHSCKKMLTKVDERRKTKDEQQTNGAQMCYWFVLRPRSSLSTLQINKQRRYGEKSPALVCRTLLHWTEAQLQHPAPAEMCADLAATGPQRCA
jgi:hypothetical protein